MTAGSMADSGKGSVAVQAVWSRPVQFALLTLVGGGLLGVVGQAAFSGARPVADSQALRSERIDLNQASRAELQLLPGVGEHLARLMEDHRPFQTVEDLRKVPGIGPRTLDRLRERVTVGLPRRTPSDSQETQLVQPARRPKQAEPLTQALNINTAVPAQLEQLPGIGPVLAERIVAERSRQPFEKVQDLRRVKGIGPKTLAKIKPWVSF
jgi:competence protein ComEA